MGLFDWFRANMRPTIRIAPETPKSRLTRADFERLKREIEPFRRLCLLPVASPGEAGTVTSKFCGSAWLAQNEAWPTCPLCGEPLQMLVQIVTNDLRDDVRAVTGLGLLQLFYCTHDCTFDSDPFGRSTLARVVAASGLGLGSVRRRPVVKQPTYPSQVITGWREAIDYPGWGGPSPPHWDETEWDLFYEVISKLPETEGPHRGDKLAGWPDWVQGIVDIHCPTCNTLMVPILQIGSEDHIPYMWGDCGIGHVHICPKHPEKCAFQWDCC
jgi:hypothetical protein